LSAPQVRSIAGLESVHGVGAASIDDAILDDRLSAGLLSQQQRECS
jgi:hypothetical protein